MKVTVTGPVEHLCPYRDEVDRGTADITFTVAGDAPELHGFARVLEQYANRKISHEALTRQLLDDLDADRVVTRWQTAGLDVTCDLSREPVRT